MTLQEFAKELREEAQRRGLTNIEVGELSGVDNSTVGKCFRAMPMSFRNYAAIAAALGKEHLDISVRELVPNRNNS